MDKITDEEKLERVRYRTADQITSAWYTYNQHYSAANFYKFCRYALSIIIITLGSFLTYALVWKTVSNVILIGLAISISVISAIQLVVRPTKKRNELRQSAQKYHVLFDDLVDFFQIRSPSEDTNVDEVVSQYESYKDRRHELNREMPDLSSFWYHYVDKTKNEESMERAFADEAEIFVLRQHLRKKDARQHHESERSEDDS